MLIESEKSIPLVGQCFRLAYILAIAFSHVPLAGWLPKGLQSGNIILLHQVNKFGTTVAKPCMTGF